MSVSFWLLGVCCLAASLQMCHTRSRMARIDERDILSSSFDDLEDDLDYSGKPQQIYSGCIHPAISTFDTLMMLTGQLKQAQGEMSRSKRIVGGLELKFGEWAFLASMRLNINGTFDHLCGGVLVHPFYVLSAAHCFEKFWKAELTDDPAFWKVRLGEHNMMEKSDIEMDMDVHNITTYPGRMFGEFDNDIAIIELKNPAKIGPYIRPICMPHPKRDRWGEGSHCLAAGWGHLTSNASSIAIVPHHVDVPLYDKEACADAYKELFAQVNEEFDMDLRISHEMICAGHEGGGKDACQYDSGGPLVCKGPRGWTLAGLVSFGFDCAQPQMPGIYTDVREFVGWVQSHIRAGMCARCARLSPPVPRSKVCRACRWNSGINF